MTIKRSQIQHLVDYVVSERADSDSDCPTDLVERDDELGNLTREIVDLVDAFKKQNEELQAQTVRDPLTGLGNRRLLDQCLDIALPMSRRVQTPLSALMIDVDHFKSYNDYYGHLAGDESLKRIAGVLKDTFQRDTDILVRHGGEEFLVVLLDTGADKALEMAESMRGMLQFAAMPHERSDTASVVTVSIGVATVEPDTQVDIEALIDSADSALYRCKTQGRNRILSQAFSPEEANISSCNQAF